MSLLKLIFSSPTVQPHYEQNYIQTKVFLKRMTVEQHYKSLPAKKHQPWETRGDSLSRRLGHSAVFLNTQERVLWGPDVAGCIGKVHSEWKVVGS